MGAEEYHCGGWMRIEPGDVAPRPLFKIYSEMAEQGYHVRVVKVVTTALPKIMAEFKEMLQ